MIAIWYFSLQHVFFFCSWGSSGSERQSDSVKVTVLKCKSWDLSLDSPVSKATLGWLPKKTAGSETEGEMLTAGQHPGKERKGRKQSPVESSEPVTWWQWLYPEHQGLWAQIMPPDSTWPTGNLQRTMCPKKGTDLGISTVSLPSIHSTNTY